MVPVKIADVFIGILFSVSLQLRVISQPTIDSFEDNSCPQLEEEWRLQAVENQCLILELANERQSLKTLKNAYHSQSEENQRLKEELENERESLKTLENVSQSQSEENQQLKDEVENGKQLVQTLSQQLDESPVFINFTERLDVENHTGVTGVTKLRNEIYVLSTYNSSHFHSNVIRVFEDRHPYRLQKKIYLSEPGYFDDIGSSETENCLYVIDTKLKKYGIWKITKETDGQYKIIKWLNTDYTPQGLSVTSDGRLLVVGLYSTILRIYGSNAQLLRTIQLPRDVEKPIHAVETSIGNYVISHHFFKEDNGSRGSVMKCGIFEVTRVGQTVIRRFIPSNETEQLRHINHLSIDSNDRVIVTDQGNQRVILLDFNLKWNRILSPTKEEKEKRIGDPVRLYYDEAKKQLIIGSFSYGVKVYSLNIK